MSSVYANTEKFVYIYDTDGNLIKPENAAQRCPDPEVNTLRVQFFFFVNNYHYISEKKSKDGKEKYIFLKSKRRIDRVKKNKKHQGANINKLSEIVVLAVEKVHKLSKEKKGKIGKHLGKGSYSVPIPKAAIMLKML